MNENTTTNKIKHFVYRILIAIAISSLSYGFLTGSFTRVELLQTWIQGSWEPEIIENGKKGTWEAILTINNTRRKDKWKESTNKEQVQPLLIVWHKRRSTWDKRQEYVRYAYEVGWYNLVSLMECENAQRTLDRRWDHWAAYGLGQVQLYRFQQIDKERFLADYKYQIEQVWELRKGWVPFYWPSRKIKWRECYIYVSNRFIYSEK